MSLTATMSWMNATAQGFFETNQECQSDGMLSFFRLLVGDCEERGLLEGSRLAEVCIALSSQESPSAPKLSTTTSCFLHSDKMYVQRFRINSVENLLSVPVHARQKAGTPSQRGCAQMHYWQHWLLLKRLLHFFE